MSSGSRLNQLQARFQQKQLEEKEQKLVRMYETQQAQALKRVGGTTSNTVTNSTGKVRQMFEERRTKGIDKSYPLQPIGLSNKTTKVGGNGVTTSSVTSKTSTRNGYHSKVDSMKSSSHHTSNGHVVRQEVTTEVRQKLNSNDLPSLNTSHRFDSDRILRDQNLNDGEFLDDVTYPDGFEQMSLENVATKLPNVGGSLPSQRQAAKLKENNNNIVTKNKPFDSVKMNGDTRVKVSPIAKKVAPSVKPVKSSSPASSFGSSTPKTSSSTMSQASSPIVDTPPAPPKARTPVERIMREEITKSPMKKAVSPSPVMSPSPKSKGSPPDSPSRSNQGAECKICKRKFDPERLAKHQTICAKTAAKKRKPYDPVKHRIEGTGVEAYVKVQRKGNKVLAIPKSGPVQLKPSNWRKKHEEFINAIRAAKEMQAHINQGGKLSDLPPPPPSENPDYVQCPNCGRRFNQSAAERHIPKCANFQFNKPKPGHTKKR